MADFLLELRCEEIPARMQPKAKEDLARLFADALAKAGLTAESVETFATPRRLALITKGLPLATTPVSEETKGPKVGAPPQALEGFLRKVGLTADELTERDGVYFAVVEKPGRDTAEVLAETIPAIIRTFPWPKSMRWGAGSITTESLRWVRPLSGLVALLDGAIVPCEIDGIASGRTTMGHRFHHSGPVEIADAGSYAETLRAAHVIVHFSERCRIIREGAAKAAAEAGLSLVADEGLVIENAGLTEYPVPLLGRFDEAFLDVPPEVIQLTARVNQKYFVCEGPDGKLANAFVCTANIASLDPAVVVDGNRKVLAARLSDARFFWEQDQKTPLAVHAEKLSRITFHEKLGTVADKVERVAKLARWLCEEGIVTSSPFPSGEGPGRGGATPRPSNTHQALNPHPLPLPEGEGASLADLAEQAARLCKADLVTEMVGEFPELQGLMGGYYAAKEGLPQEVAAAIRDHYKPVGQGDDVPTAPVTVAVSLADKLDTIFSFFGIEKAPTGSKDPFALRRAAIAVLRTMEKCRLRLPLERCVDAYHGIALADDQPRVSVFALSEALDQEWIPENGRGQPVIEPTYLVLHEEDYPVEPIVWRALLPYFEFEERSSLVDDELCNLATFVARDTVLVYEAVADFLADRLKVQQREAGVRHDLIDAVFALGGEDDLVRLLARVHALQAFVTTEDGTNLLAGYKRAANILKKSPLPEGEGSGVGGATPDPSNPHPQPVDAARQLRFPQGEGAQELSYAPEPAEQALIEALDAAAPRAAAAVEAERFADAMAALASLRAPIDRFFEEVTVNADEVGKRAARLALLAQFRDAVHRVADFSRIEG